MFFQDQWLPQITGAGFCRRRNHHPAGVFREEIEVITGLIGNGFGISVLPYMDIVHLHNLVAIPVQTSIWKSKFYIAKENIWNPLRAGGIVTSILQKYWGIIVWGHLLTPPETLVKTKNTVPAAPMSAKTVFLVRLQGFEPWTP